MSDNPDTVQLLERIGQGDRSATELLMQRHRELLRQYIELRLEPGLRQRVDPSDVVQEAQIEIIRRLDDFLVRNPMPFHVWIRKTAWQNLARLRRYHLQTEGRNQLREVRLPDSISLLLIRSFGAGPGQPLDELVRRELTMRVQEAVNELSEIDREILLLRAWEGLDNQSVATVLDLDPGTTSKRYARALLRLRQALVDDLTDHH